jgi:ABC-type phosphate transport system substrate-binding protein
MHLKLRHGRFVVALLAAITASLMASAAPAAASASLTGGGSGFAALEIDQWRADTARNPYNLQITYVAQGSSVGRGNFSSGLFDYGASDIYFQGAELPELQQQRCHGKPPNTGCFVYVPVSAGGLAFMYNVLDNSGRRINTLHLTRKAACGIFTGAIRKWNDPKIVATNPTFADLNRTIEPVVRSDGAGESFVLSQFCIDVASDVWKAFIADRQANDPSNVGAAFASGQPVSNWPIYDGVLRTAAYADNVANVVADPGSGKDSITYVANGYAKVRNMPVAYLQNAAGQYTLPSETNVTVALSYASPRGDGTFNLNFRGSDPRSYFPSTYSYILAQTGGYDKAKGAALGTFLCYAVSAGQPEAPQLGYARLSRQIVDISIDAIVKIPGAPGKSSCFVGSQPAPDLFGSAGVSAPTGGSGPAATSNTGAVGGPAAGGFGASGATGGSQSASGGGAANNGAKSSSAARKTTQTVATGPKYVDQPTIAPERVDQMLAAQTTRLKPESKGISATWVLVIGIAAAWAITFIARRRRKAAA